MTAARSAIDPILLMRRTRTLVDANRASAARPLLDALRRLDPDPGDFADLEARLLVREGRQDDAVAVLDGAIERNGADRRLLLHRSELRMVMGNLMLAADDAAAALIAEPKDTQAKAVLGLALIRLGRSAEAATCLTEAVAASPSHPGFRQALAEALEAAGQKDAAAATLDAALARWPSHLPLRLAAIMHAMRSRTFQRAVDLAQAARGLGVADARIFGLLGHALSNQGRHAEASDAYAEALKLAPEDANVRHLVRASGLLPQATRAPAEYVTAVFDGYADRFEQHLIDLGYRVPGLFRTAVLTNWGAGRAAPTVLDLGCGTGFVGVALSDLPISRLVGVDLSGGMLAHARAKGIYAELIQADIETVLSENAETWDIILAADVLNYFGDLRGIADSIRARLRPGGLFMVSLEALVDQDADADGMRTANGDWRLQCQGRFAHALGYIQSATRAAGLRTLAIADECLRFEAGAPVAGVVGIFTPALQ